jgi:hypothetical protein
MPKGDELIGHGRFLPGVKNALRSGILGWLAEGGLLRRTPWQLAIATGSGAEARLG